MIQCIQMRRTCSPAAPIKAPCTMFRNTTPKPLPNNTENIIQWQMVKTRKSCCYCGYFYNITYFVACLRSALMVLKRKWDQGCTMPNLCSWATRKSYNVFFSYKSYAGHPGFHKFRALGSLQFSLEHRWGLQKHDKLTTFFLHIPATFPLPKFLSFSLPYAN